LRWLSSAYPSQKSKFSDFINICIIEFRQAFAIVIATCRATLFEVWLFIQKAIPNLLPGLLLRLGKSNCPA